MLPDWVSNPGPLTSDRRTKGKPKVPSGETGRGLINMVNAVLHRKQEIPEQS